MDDRIRAALFDLDGTLMNTLRDIAGAMNYALREFGLREWDTEEYRYLVGNGAKVLAQRAVRDRLDLAEKVRTVYQRQYETHNRVYTRPYPGIPEALARLAERETAVCVFSNKPHRDTVNVLEYYLPGIPFSAILGQTDRFPVKPDPAGALWIAEKLDIAPSEFIYVGDSAVDMSCAVRAGMHPVGALWGFRDEKELTEGGAEKLVSRPEELPELLLP